MRHFLEVSSNFKIHGITDDAFRLRLFPYSLRDIGKFWLNSLEPNYISTSSVLDDKFLTKYSPPIKNEKMNNVIPWCGNCLNNSLNLSQVSNKDQLETFKNGLVPPLRNMLDASFDSALLSKSCEKGYKLI